MNLKPFDLKEDQRAPSMNESEQKFSKENDSL